MATVQKFMKKISREEIKKLGELARLALSDEEIARFQTDVSGILDYFETLKDANTDGVSELIHPLEIFNDFREDVAKRPLSEDSNFLLSQAPNKEKNYIKTKKIFENEG